MYDSSQILSSRNEVHEAPWPSISQGHHHSGVGNNWFRSRYARPTLLRYINLYGATILRRPKLSGGAKQNQLAKSNPFKISHQQEDENVDSPRRISEMKRVGLDVATK